MRKGMAGFPVEMPQDVPELPASSQGLIAMFEEGWEEAMNEVGELKGYPVKTIMQMEMGGRACLSLSRQPIAMDDMWSNALNSGMQSGADTAAGSTVLSLSAVN